MGERKLENVERMFLKGLKQSMSQKSRKNHCYYFGDFGLKICMGHVFPLWLLLERSKAYATKRNPF